VEIVFVQLANEGSEVAVLEMLREDVFGELLVLSSYQRIVVVIGGLTCLQDHKAVSAIPPPHYILVLSVLKHPVARALAIWHGAADSGGISYLYNLRT
jgi:hypothetical protein